jgi:TPR repeat protein
LSNQEEFYMKYYLHKVIAAVALGSLCLPVLAGFKEGMTAKKNNDFVVALDEFRSCLPSAACKFGLGIMYHNGQGVPQNYRASVNLFRESAEQGYARAQFQLGVMYKLGIGVPKNDTESVRWYRLAADQNIADAQMFLGAAYTLGKGVVKNPIIGYALSNLAAAYSGDGLAIEGREISETDLSPASISIAQGLSTEMYNSGKVTPVIDRYLRTGK